MMHWIPLYSASLAKNDATLPKRKEKGIIYKNNI